MEKQDEKKDWANMSDDEEAEREVPKEQVQDQEKKVKVPKPMKGVKNDRGDYVVTTIDIVETRTTKKEKKEEVDEESDSDEGYGEEEDKQEDVKEEVKVEAKPGKYKLNSSVKFIDCVFLWWCREEA